MLGAFGSYRAPDSCCSLSVQTDHREVIEPQTRSMNPNPMVRFRLSASTRFVFRECFESDTTAKGQTWWMPWRFRAYRASSIAGRCQRKVPSQKTGDNYQQNLLLKGQANKHCMQLPWRGWCRMTMKLRPSPCDAHKGSSDSCWYLQSSAGLLRFIAHSCIIIIIPFFLHRFKYAGAQGKKLICRLLY